MLFRSDLIGVVLALVAVVLVSREATDEDAKPHKFTTKVSWLTVGSGLAFGLNFVLIAQAPTDAGLWPLVFARLAASTLVLVIAGLAGSLNAPTGTALRLALLAAVLEILSSEEMVVDPLQRAVLVDECFGPGQLRPLIEAMDRLRPAGV